MLVDDMKKQLMVAMKGGDTVTKEILRVALGEIQTVQARGGTVDDAEVQQILRKLIKSNDETMAVATDAGQKATLTRENEVLGSFLPKSLGVDAIVEALAPVRDALRAAPNDGAATGVAMKHLKSLGAVVGGKDVGEAVRKVRS